LKSASNYVLSFLITVQPPHNYSHHFTRRIYKLMIILDFIFAVIPQTCWYNGNVFDCSLSISCIIDGGKPLDLCSGGLIWSCCVTREKVTTSTAPPAATVLAENTSK